MSEKPVSCGFSNIDDERSAAVVVVLLQHERHSMARPAQSSILLGEGLWFDMMKGSIDFEIQ